MPGMPLAQPARMPWAERAFAYKQTHVLALITLAIILVCSVLIWPVTYLGFNVDPLSATIIAVEPHGSAAAAGLQVGDQIRSMYGQPWEAVINAPNMLVLIGPREQPIAIKVERQGVVFSRQLAQTAPSFDFQLAKATNIVLVLLCWLTGYVLAIMRRHESAGSPLVAWFWLLLSATLAAYFFGRYASYPLRLVLDWLLLSILLPLAVAIHAHFPVRPTTPQQTRRTWRALVTSWLLINGLLALAVAIWRPRLVELVIQLSDLLLVGFVICFCASGVIVWRAYRRTSIEHIRRQMRLLALACYFVAIAWLLLLVLPMFLRGAPLIADHWIDLVTGLIPLAYLVGGIAPDLYRLDRVALRLGVHAGTVTILAGLFVGAATVFAWTDTMAVLWMILAGVLVYRSMFRLGLYLVPAHANPAHNSYQGLHASMTALTTTLDAPALIEIVCAGVRSTFGAPALGFYAGDILGGNTLTLLTQQRLTQLPPAIQPGALADLLLLAPPIIESRTVQAALAPHALRHEEVLALHQPGLVLWCPLRHAEGHLLGVLLLGMRGDLDPYRETDLHELRRLLEAAGLAFTNSAAYSQQREAEQMIRQLYEQLQQSQDATAAAIARELHDEILNVNVRLNIESLQQLVGQIQDLELRTELELVLESEHSVATALRMICEHLHPTGIDDPLGLASVLRMQLEQVRASWAGTCRLVVDQAPQPIPAHTQHEALRITREALNNAIKHAQASEIVVSLWYSDSDTSDGIVRLKIQDNGRGDLPVISQPGHFGVRNMQERARAVGGSLAFEQTPGQGTAVIFTFAAAPQGEHPEAEQMKDTHNAARQSALAA